MFKKTEPKKKIFQMPKGYRTRAYVQSFHVDESTLMVKLTYVLYDDLYRPVISQQLLTPVKKAYQNLFCRAYHHAWTDVRNKKAMEEFNHKPGTEFELEGSMLLPDWFLDDPEEYLR